MNSRNVRIAFCAVIALSAGCSSAPASKDDIQNRQPSGQAAAQTASPGPAENPRGAGEEVKKKRGAGEPSWEETFGGVLDDKASSVRQTSDGGYVIAGTTESKGAGAQDVWVIKLDGGGNLEWDRTYGGSKTDEAYGIEQTADGGFIVAGSTESKGAGARDGWVIKLKSDGGLEWDRTYGGIFWDEIHSIVQTKDGGYIAAGYTEPSGAGAHFLLIMKLDKKGNVTWSKTYGRSKWDEIESLSRATGGGTVAAGYTESSGTSLSHDAWVIKIPPDGKIAGLKEIEKPVAASP